MKPYRTRNLTGCAACLLIVACCAIGQSSAQESESAGESAVEDDRNWSFQPVRRPPVPAARAEWLGTPIDAFLAVKWKEHHLRPAPPADRRTLLRRVFLDLIGLPPTPAEQQAFLHDRSPDALDRVVDDLLNRPQYGERWARHWLDVARYAESNGYERDGTKPHAWRFRDYVIDALNQDKPYDRFLIEQLAGDEIEGSNAETQIATTFMRLGTWDDEPAEFTVDRYEQLDDVLGTTATAFLGLTLRCARCHDHKFEPFTQRDYYQALAVFEPLKRPQNIVSATHRKEHDRTVGSVQQLREYAEAIKQTDAELDSLQRKLQELDSNILDRLSTKNAATAQPTLPADAVAAFKQLPKKRSAKQNKLVKKFAKQFGDVIGTVATALERTTRSELVARIGMVTASRPAKPPRAYVWYEDTPQPPKTHIFKRGDPTKPDDEVGPGVPAVLVKRQPLPPAPLEKSTGRRIWFARWMAGRQNPLTARVMVNRIWQHHFDEGLVATESDFGIMGEFPTHPRLLDWLAAEFMDGGWRMKRMHRLIVLSSVYQMSSQFDAASARVDPENKLLWHWPQRRLDAEVVRDSVLAVSGRLNARMHGPSIYPTLPQAVLDGQSRPGSGWGKSTPEQQARRSVYIFIKRSLAVPELDLLDAPNRADSCEQRPVSTTGPQALTFLNGRFMQQHAGRFAARLGQESSDAKSQIERAFGLALCRAPRDDELTSSLRFLTEQQQQIATDGENNPTVAARKALTAFCVVLLNTNEFVYTR